MVVLIALVPTNDDPETGKENTGTKTEAQQAGEDLTKIANHSGAYVAWYVDQVSPLCKEYYAADACRPAVYELQDSPVCGVMPLKRLRDWSDLPNGPIYFVRMESGRGITTGYKEISYGVRYQDFPPPSEVFLCWDDVGILQ